MNLVAVEFEWDPAKAASNFRKHGISFETATRVFSDASALVERDRNVDGEDRWLAIGVVEGWLMLTVAHWRERIRIISARRADRKERRRYEEND